MNRLFLKTTLAVLVCSILTFNSHSKVFAGDREWATVGKILTGALGVIVVSDVLDDGYYHQRPYYTEREVIVVKETPRRSHRRKRNRYCNYKTRCRSRYNTTRYYSYRY